MSDYFRPFANRLAREIRSVDRRAVIFAEGVSGGIAPRWGPQDARDVVHAPHWYDGLTVYLRHFIPFIGVDFATSQIVLGRRRVRRSRAKQLGRLKDWSQDEMGGMPTLIGEFGVPQDLQAGRAYRTGDFSRQIAALDASFRALEANLLSGTLWNYTADNSNRWGDQWNNEDYSIFSRDQQADADDVNSGGRALEAVVRPYPSKIAGEPLRMSFDMRLGVFEFEFRDDPDVTAPTEIFVPGYQYPDGYLVDVSDGTYRVSGEEQALVYRHSPAQRTHSIRIRRRSRA